MKEITSREGIAEIWCAVKHLLHIEGHLEEMLSKLATQKGKEFDSLLSELDDIRSMRQSLVKDVIPDNKRMNRYWCSIKHILQVEGHLEEIIANAARSKDNKLARSTAKSLANITKTRKRFLGTISNGACNRCPGDVKLRTN